MYMGQNKKNGINIEKFNSIYYFEFGKDFTHTPESHDFWEMVYVDNGRINAISDGRGFMLEQGQVIFHEPMEVHAHISDKHVANNMMVISFTTQSENMNFFKNKILTLDKTSKTILSLFLKEARNALGHIPNDYSNKETLHFIPSVFGGEQLLLCYFTEFLITLIRNGSNAQGNITSAKSSRDIAVNSMSELIVEYMKKNLSSNLTLKNLCEHFIIGKTQLCQIFNQNLGQSPMEYYSGLKIEEAKKLLREKNYSVTQISDMLGYSSVHTFSRAFKQAAGFSPTAYMHSIL